MADWRLRVQRAWLMTGGKPSFVFDTVIRESHTSDLDIPEEPLETGVVASDHVVLKPWKLDIEARVSDNPTRGQQPGDMFASDSSRSAKAWSLLRDLQASGEPFDVQTGLELYREGLVASLSVEQDKRTGAILAVRASLRGVTRVSTRTVVYPPRADAKTRRKADKRAGVGEKKTTPVTKAEPAKSVLLQAGVAAGQGTAAVTALVKQLIGGDAPPTGGAGTP